MANETIQAKINLDAKQANKSLKDLKKELKDINTALQEMSVGGEAFEMLSKASKEYKDEIKAIQDEINGVAKVASVSFRDVSNSITGGFAVAVGALNMMGVESQRLGQIQKTVQSAIAIAVGVRNLSESKLNATMIKNGAITVKNKVWTLALAGAQKVVVGTTKAMGIAANVSSKGFKALKVAIASTGIGLIVVAVGMIAAYWEDIVGFMMGGTTEAQKQLEATTAKKDAAFEELEAVEGSTAQMELQGMSQKEILQAKITAVEAAIQAAEVEHEAQKAAIQSDIDRAKTGKKVAAMLLKLVTAPIDAAIWLYNQIPLVADLEYASDTIAGMFFDVEGIEEEGLKTLKEQEKVINGLKEKKASLILQQQNADKQAGKNSREQREKEAAELRKLEEEIAIAALELDEEKALLRLQHQKQYELDALEGKKNAKEQEKLIEEKYRTLLLEAEQELSAKRKELAEETANKVASFNKQANELLLESHQELADEIKDLQVEILEAQGETIEERQARELADLQEKQRITREKIEQELELLAVEVMNGKASQEVKDAYYAKVKEVNKLEVEQDEQTKLVLKLNELELQEFYEDEREKQKQAILDTFNMLTDAISANLDARMQETENAQQREIDEEKRKSEELIEAADGDKDKITQIKQEQENNVKAINDEFLEKKKRIDKRQKAIAAAQAIIDTYASAVAAYKSMAGIPVVGAVLAPIAAGAATLAGLASVRQIYAQDVGDGGGGGGGGGGGTPSTPKPAKVPSAGRFSLGQGQKDEPVKAYVVTDEMTDSQDQLENIRRRATI